MGKKVRVWVLTLCKRFIDLNLGKISVSSKEGEGTIFKVVLPCSTDGTGMLLAQKDSGDVTVA